MHTHGTDGIVDVKLEVEQLDNKNNQKSGNNSDHGSADCIKSIASGGYGHKTCERGIETHGNIGLAVSYPCKEHGRNGCNEGAIVVVRKMEASSGGSLSRRHR